MAAVIQRLQCSQIPDVTILGVGSNPSIYLAHMQHIIGRLLKKLSAKSANTAMHSFLKSDAGRAMQQGGDLTTAYLRGPLAAMIYTHQLGTDPARLSYFVTMDGAKYILDSLPNQDEAAKQKLLTLLQDHLVDQAKASSCFQPASDDQCMVDDDDSTEDYGGSELQLPQTSMYRIFTAENRALVAQLKAAETITLAKDEVINVKNDLIIAKNAESQAKDAVICAKNDLIETRKMEAEAQIAKERAEKEAAMAKQEVRHIKECAVKDAKIMELQMQLLSVQAPAGVKSNNGISVAADAVSANVGVDDNVRTDNGGTNNVRPYSSMADNVPRVNYVYRPEKKAKVECATVYWTMALGWMISAMMWTPRGTGSETT